VKQPQRTPSETGRIKKLSQAKAETGGDLNAVEEN